MNTLNPWRIIATSLMTISGAVAATAAIAQDQYANDTNAEVLTRGPIHEAYANQTAADRVPNSVIRKEPPAGIDEMPPDQKPDGDNVTWIPGYWSWDDDRGDYIWISGVWRDIPPNRQWIPGYWASVSGGYQYVSGYWEDYARRESEYLPAPPEPLDVGANSPAPGPNYVWAPGSWVWVPRNSYRWQPGYWVVVQPGWVWTPSYYVWTPRGYIYVAGYWDYAIEDRGLCFAPVYYRQPVYHRTGYYYSPSVAIDFNIAIGHLFISVSSHHYYFGDYYEDRYRRRGYEPCWSYRDRHDRYRDYDPIFIQYRHEQLRRDRDWDRHIDAQYQYRREHKDARPPRTFVAMREVESRRSPRDVEREQLAVAKPLKEIRTRSVASERPQQLARVNMDQRRELLARNKDVDQFRAERQKTELRVDSTPDGGRPDAVREAPRDERSSSSKGSRTDAKPSQPDRSPQQEPRQPTTTRTREAAPQPQPPIHEDNSSKQRDRVTREQTPTPQPAPREDNSPKQRDRVTREQAPAPEEQTREPERRSMRQSPVAAKPETNARRQAPAKPDVPQPDMTRQEPSKPQEQPQRVERHDKKSQSGKDTSSKEQKKERSHTPHD